MIDPARPSEVSEVARWLEDAGVVAVVLGFVGPSAIVRSKTVPIARFPQAAETGVGLSTLFNAGMSNDRFALSPGYIDGPSGDLRLRADPAATVPLAAMPGWAWAPVDQYTQDGEPFAACPRRFARRMVDALADRGLSVQAAYEFEFSVGRHREDGGFEPAHEGPGYSDIALVANHAFALDLIATMQAQGLQLQQFHPEYADGQFELSIAPREPVAAADAAMIVRQTVRAVAARHGWSASFAPRVEADTGNGTHLHLSLWEQDRPLMSGGDGPAGMQERGEAFVAGILRELPKLVAVAAPTCVSYLRLQPEHWAGAMQCWGTENREASLRFVAGATPQTAGGANVEVKPVDGTANPYLAVGAMLAAGLHGLDTGDRLPPSTEEDPMLLPEDVREERGVRQLPASLSEAAERARRVHGAPRGDGGLPVRDVPRDPARGGREYEGFDDDGLIRNAAVAVLSRDRPVTQRGARERVDLTGADVVDAHCHPFRSQDLLDRDPTAFETRCMYLGTALISSNHANHELAAFVEELTETTLFGLALRRWLARYLGCEPTKDAVVAARDAALRADPPGYVRGCWTSEHVVAVVADEGYPQPTIPREDFEAALGGVPVHRVGRIEPWIVDAREEGTFDGHRAAVRGAVNAGGERPAARRRTRRSSRTAPAWTSRTRRRADAAAAYDRWRADDWRETREHAKPVRDFLLERAFELAKEHDRVVPRARRRRRPGREPRPRDASRRLQVLRRPSGHPDRDDPLGVPLGRRGHVRRVGAAERLPGRLRAGAHGDGGRSTGRSR